MESLKTELTPPNVFALSLEALDKCARRALDITASGLGLLLLAPVLAIIAVFIKRDSPGPIFFRGPRVGKHGKPFGILKFRTMYERPDSYQGPRVTGVGDNRITPLGHWLRDTKINELPQLWNVLVGDMSLVGPRPEDPEIAMQWPVDQRSELLSVRPGITSPATVLFRSEEEMLQSTNVMDDYLRSILPDKLRLDCNYLRSRNLLTDLDVIFMTLLLLLPRLRKADIPETALYWGPIARFVSRNLNWFLMDTVAAFFATGLSAFLWRLNSPFNVGFTNWIGISIGVGFCFSIINSILGLTKVHWRRAPSHEVILLAFSSACSTLIMILVENHLWPGSSLPLAMQIFAGVLSFLGFTFLRYRERVLTGFATIWLSFRKSNQAMGEKVLLVGAGRNSQLAIWFLTHSEFARLFRIVGIVDDDPRKQGMYFDGFRVIGTTRDIPDLVDKYKVSKTIFAITNISEKERQRIIWTCQSAKTSLVVFPDVMAELTLRFQAAAVKNQGLYSTVGD